MASENWTPADHAIQAVDFASRHFSNPFESKEQARPSVTSTAALDLADRMGKLFNTEDEAPSETDFAAQASELEWTGPNGREDFRRLSSLCLDLQATCEEDGASKDIMTACKVLLNRDGVPQRLRSILWSQLLRPDMSGLGEEGEVDRRASVPAWMGSEFLAENNGVCTHSPTARRFTVYDPLHYERTRKEETDRQDQVEKEPNESRVDSRNLSGTFEIDRGVSEGVLPLLATKKEKESQHHLERWVDDGDYEVYDAMSMDKLDKEKAALEQALHDLADEQSYEEKMALQAIVNLGLNPPPNEDRCTCIVKCHCIYGLPRRPSTPAPLGPAVSFSSRASTPGPLGQAVSFSSGESTQRASPMSTPLPCSPSIAGRDGPASDASGQSEIISSGESTPSPSPTSTPGPSATVRLGHAGHPPGKGQPSTPEPRLDLGWYDKGLKADEQKQVEKRDSIHPWSRAED